MAPSVKRRKLDTHKVEEIVFDNTARHDYLTGFHKRKVQRAKHAQEVAAARARQEKIEDRKKVREDRKAEIERHVREVNEWFRPAQDIDVEGSDNERNDTGVNEEWTELEQRPNPPLIDHEDEYIDEDKYTTVTVEAVDVSREGLSKADVESDEDENQDKETPVETNGNSEKTRPTKTKKPLQNKQDKVKKKRKKFRYEKKADRKMNRFKERAKNSKQARARRNG